MLHISHTRKTGIQGLPLLLFLYLKIGRDLFVLRGKGHRLHTFIAAFYDILNPLANSRRASILHFFTVFKNVYISSIIAERQALIEI